LDIESDKNKLMRLLFSHLNFSKLICKRSAELMNRRRLISRRAAILPKTASIAWYLSLVRFGIASTQVRYKCGNYRTCTAEEPTKV
jgi:hypothetical protein